MYQAPLDDLNSDDLNSAGWTYSAYTVHFNAYLHRLQTSIYL